MNEMIYPARIYLFEGELSLIQISKKINGTIYSPLDYYSPLKVLKEMD
jgi:hypothetical protein